MIDAGILDGDYVVVRRQQDARNGDIVVALAGEDEARRRGDGQAVLPRERPHPAAARERRARADLRAARPGPRQGDRRLPAVVSEEAARSQPLARPGAAALVRGVSLECLVCGEFVLRLPDGSVFCPECGCVARGSAAEAPGYNGRCRPGDRGLASGSARGKSGHRRAGRWGNPRRRKPTESGTERRPPPATRSLRRRRR